MDEYRNLSQPEVEKLALQLGRAIKNKRAFIGFVGPLGSGKTTFIKALAEYFKIKHITSPTFVISHEYKIAQGTLYHLDFYRLNKPKDLVPIGLEEMLRNRNIVLAEWIDRFPNIADLCDIIITLKVKPENKRNVTVQIN